MKRQLGMLLSAVSLVIGMTAGAAAANYSDEMKMTEPSKITTQEGAASVERQFDHRGTPYFSHPDIFHMKSNSTRTILTGFHTLQQSSEWSCGPAAALMALQWYGRAGTYTEEKLAAFRHPLQDVHVEGFPDGYPGTTFNQMEDIFNRVGGFTYEDSNTYKKKNETLTPQRIQEELKQGHPILVAWIDWGGHWQVIIGYDTMGTESMLDDVLIVADSYDVTDHNQDGYGIYPAARFFSVFNMYGQFPEREGGNQQLFLIPKPIFSKTHPSR